MNVQIVMMANIRHLFLNKEIKLFGLNEEFFKAFITQTFLKKKAVRWKYIDVLGIYIDDLPLFFYPYAVLYLLL